MSGEGLIGIDWGSSHLRAYRFDPLGQVLETRARPWGVRALPAGGFPAALDQLLGDWPDLPLLACGMVGSRHGWREVPYRTLPADAQGLARALGRVELPARGQLSIVPGLHTERGPDVMRGEETQVVGALAQHPELRHAARIVLPGTHSKWVTVQAGRVDGFRTAMTGELYALLRQHSVLGAGMTDAEPAVFHPAAFRRGVLGARDSGAAGMLSRLFSARTLWLDDLLPAQEIADYLSGLLIGEELRVAAVLGDVDAREPLRLIGEPTLCARYVAAIDAFGWPAAQLVEQAAARGLWEIAVQAELLRGFKAHHRGSVA